VLSCIFKELNDKKEKDCCLWAQNARAFPQIISFSPVASFAENGHYQGIHNFIAMQNG
jgi:hypothetical protein